MKQRFRPNPGKIAVVREYIEEVVASGEREDGSKYEIFRTEESQQWERKINPWALVVGVGEPRVTDFGTVVKTDIREGDKVLIGMVGTNVTLKASDGEEATIYVLPFEGVMGRLEWTCEKCGKTFTQLDGDRCPECPVIEAPDMAAVVEINRTKQ